MDRVFETTERCEIELFSGPGEMARLMRETDWSATALGDPDLWPRSLRVAVRLLLGSGYPMYIAWGPEFIQLYNDAYRPILGRLKHPSALGSPSPQTFPEIWDFIGPMFRRVMLEGQETTLRSQALPLDRNGYLEECYYDFSYSPIPDDNLGKVGGVFVTCSEVTNQVLEQRRLKTVRDLASSDPDARTPEAVCTAAAKVLGQNLHDIPFAAIYLIDAAEPAARLAAASGAEAGDLVCPVAMAISDEEPWPVQSLLESVPLLHLTDIESRFSQVPKGAWPEAPKEAVLIPFAGASLDPVGFIVMGLNPRKQFDDPMEQFLVRCAHVVAGRIANARAYEDARRRAESLAELDRAKTVFFSNISHEFRTPLTLIASPLDDLAASASLVPIDRERVELAQRNVIRLQRLVNNLLDFSRIEAGRVNAAFEPVDLAALTAELASGFRSTYEKAGLALQVHARPLSAPVYVDREMWEKIVLNLLSNAFKFTLEGRVTVELVERPTSVEVCIADTGVGIPATELPRIFQRFHRVEGTLGRSYEGTGIGLALVQELVKLHGGSIEVTSQEGVGTRFTISLRKGAAHLDPERIRQGSASIAVSTRVDGFVMEALRWIHDPASESDPIRAVPFSSEPIEDRPAPPQQRRHRVLVVDDNADMRMYISRLLEPSFEVDTAANGNEAMEQIRRSRPHLVLTDVMMPVMDGYALLNRIRSTREIAALPVIMVSARAGSEMEIEGREAGADDYITKPFSARELVGRVRSALHIAEIRAASEAAVRASENRSRQVLERTTDAVFVLDRDWRFSYLNPNAEDLISNRRDLIGKCVWEEFPEAVGTEFWRQYHRVMNEGASVVFQEYYPAPLDKWFEVHAYPTEEGLAAFFRDITLKVKSEAALRQTEKLAAVGRLASSIAHEINNPLEAITNLLFLMESDEQMQPRTREFLQSAQSELTRVSHIATQTLRFHRQSAHPSKVKIADILDSVFSLYATRLPDGLSIERQYRSDASLAVYPGELRQVFSNLLRNAMDAVGQNGRIIIREQSGADPRTGDQGIRITVADSGHGMDRALQSRLFEPFFSTKPTTGTGLGLWVSKEIIDKHRGRIRVRSSVDPNRRGTIFSVFLPVDGASRATAAAGSSNNRSPHALNSAS